MRVFKRDNPVALCDVFLPVTVILETKKEYTDFISHYPDYINNRVALLKNDNESYFCECKSCQSYREDEKIGKGVN